MKIDIITRHSVPNYGSVLQTYATQKKMGDLGYEVEIINYTRYDERYKNLANTLMKGKKWEKSVITRLIYKMIQTPNYAKMYKKFSKYRRALLKETEIEYGNIQELKDNVPNADIYCSGSDQIWGKIGTAEYDEAYFLEFVKNKKCISYASSFGKTELSPELDKNVDKLLKKYSTILVREDSAKEILEKKGFNNVKHVLDPTLLLDNKEWMSLAKLAKIKYKDYVLVYQLHDNKQFDKYAKEFAQRKKKKLLRISPSLYHIVRSGKLVYLPSMYEFLALFKNADCILTDSFHATVFSVIFNKNFIDILPGETSTRIISLLKMLNLEDRVLKDYNDFSLINEKIDYSEKNSILDKKRKESIDFLKKAVESDVKSIDLMDKHYKCCGCRTCEKVCPKNAIKIIKNKEGYLEPQIDYTKCINCGVCLKKCPQLTNVEIKDRLDTKKVFAAVSKDEKSYKKSSSGGVFSVLAEYIFEQNGAVYGAAFNENLDIGHIRIESGKELNKLRGSKYIQSDTRDTFLEVQQDLKSGKKVLYVGTPCQIAGLRSFLNIDYDNLLLCDLICHGVPSNLMFKKYISNLERVNNSKVINYFFRTKDNNFCGDGVKIEFSNGKVKYIPCNVDSYYQNFISGAISRECCYNCKYASENRMGDMTIADYWGIEKQHPDFYNEKGVSAVIINTQKGNTVFNKIEQKINYISSDIQKLKEKNANLVLPTKKSIHRKNAYNNIEKKEYKKILKENLRYNTSKKSLIKNCIPRIIRVRLKKIKIKRK